MSCVRDTHKGEITKLTHLTKGRSIDCEVGVASVWEEHLLRPWNLQRKEKRRARPTTYRCSLYRHCPSPLSVCGPGGSRYLPHSQQYGVECYLDFRGIVCEVIDDTQCLHDGRSHQQELIVLVSGETILAVSDVVGATFRVTQCRDSRPGSCTPDQLQYRMRHWCRLDRRRSDQNCHQAHSRPSWHPHIAPA